VRTPATSRQAGGHWFEPSTAHQSTPWKRRVFSCSEAWTASSSPWSQNGHARPVDAAGYAGSTVKIARTSCSTSSACGKSSFATTRNCSPRPSRNIGGDRRTPSVVDSVRASGWVHCPFVQWCSRPARPRVAAGHCGAIRVGAREGRRDWGQSPPPPGVWGERSPLRRRAKPQQRGGSRARMKLIR
jgi:hypothetical protein